MLDLQENISLQPYNTLAIPAQARWFVTVDSIDSLHQAVIFYRQLRERDAQCPLLILGGGSNLVLAEDFPGLCIHIATQGRHIENETDDTLLLSVAAGESWHQTVMYCVEQGYYGIENLALIPGSVGAAPIQNIGAYGVELERCLAYVEVMDIETGELSQLSCEACEFGYRDSVFKHQLNHKVIITRVVLELRKQACWVLDYPALQVELKNLLGGELGAELGIELDAEHVDEQKLDLQIVAKAVINVRQSKLPDPADIPNAGSFFKNPVVSEACYQRIKSEFPQLVAFPHQGDYKLAAGWLLDNAGWKGKDLNGFAMHKDQALVLTNPNCLSGDLLLKFVETVKADIKSRYQLDLEVEPRIIGTSLVLPPKSY